MGNKYHNVLNGTEKPLCMKLDVYRGTEDYEPHNTGQYSLLQDLSVHQQITTQYKELTAIILIHWSIDYYILIWQHVNHISGIFLHLTLLFMSNIILL